MASLELLSEKASTEIDGLEAVTLYASQEIVRTCKVMTLWYEDEDAAASAGQRKKREEGFCARGRAVQHARFWVSRDGDHETEDIFLSTNIQIGRVYSERAPG
jgi:hypothetical protein